VARSIPGCRPESSRVGKKVAVDKPDSRDIAVNTTGSASRGDRNRGHIVGDRDTVDTERRPNKGRRDRVHKSAPLLHGAPELLGSLRRSPGLVPS